MQRLYRKDGNDKLNELATFNSDETLTGGKPLIYDAVDNSLKEADDSLTLPDDVAINGTLTVNGDAYINGTTHTVTTEDVSATGDILTLRSNNPSGLANGQVSGVVINKYNGSDDLAIVSDNSGTVRVGTGTGTDTSYTKIALKHSDNQYYTYDDQVEPYTYTLLSPQPSGTLTAWTNKTEVSGYTLYATATFTVIDNTTLEPLATRAEENDMSDNALVKWDASNIEIQTVLPQSGKRIVLEDATDGIEFAPNPTSNGQVLQASISGGTVDTYYYEDAYPNVLYNDDFSTYSGTPAGTAGTPVVQGYYYTINDDWYKKNGTGDYLLVTSFTDTGTAVSDPSLIQQLDETTFFEFYSIAYTTPVTTGYVWGNITGNYVFNTMADYTAVASTIPNGSTVIILSDTNYVKAEI